MNKVLYVLSTSLNYIINVLLKARSKGLKERRKKKLGMSSVSLYHYNIQAALQVAAYIHEFRLDMRVPKHHHLHLKV